MKTLKSARGEIGRRSPPRGVPMISVADPTDSISRATAEAHLKDLVLGLARGRSLDRGQCRGWTAAHASLAHAHGVAPWLWACLRAKPEAELPLKVTEALRRSYIAAVLDSLARDSLVGSLLPEFGARDIPVALLKGAFLGRVVYGDAALRTMCDVDILVPESRFPASRTIMESNGFRQLAAISGGFSEAFSPSVSYVRDGIRPVTVDLHWSIRAMDYYTLHPGILWSEVREGPSGIRGALFLSKELNFIHVGLHAIYHGMGLRDTLDVILFMRTIGLDWNRLVSLAESLGVMRPLFWLFREVRAHVESPPPPDVVARLAAYRPRLLEDAVIRSPYRRLWQWFSRLVGMPGWQTRLTYLHRELFPPPAHRQATLGTAAWAVHFTYGLRRFIRSCRPTGRSQERVQHIVDEADDDRSRHGPPEGLHDETGNNGPHQPEEERVDHQEKQAEGHDGERKGQEYENRLEKGIDNSENRCGDQRGAETGHSDSGKQIRNDNDRYRGNDPTNQDPHVSVLPLKS